MFRLFWALSSRGSLMFQVVVGIFLSRFPDVKLTRSPLHGLFTEFVEYFLWHVPSTTSVWMYAFDEVVAKCVGFVPC